MQARSAWVFTFVVLWAVQAAFVATTHAQTSSPFERSVTGSEGWWQRYTLEIPAGTASLDVVLSGGAGDADLYVRFAEQPDDASYDCRSNQTGTDETCSISAPSAGTWHIAIAGKAAFSDVDVKASWGPTAAPTDTQTPPELDWTKQILDRHNVVRAQHCAAELTWSDEIAASAQEYANRCVWKHDSATPYGENLAYRDLNASALSTIDAWYAEGANYDFAQPGFSLQTGHFTQVVWNASTNLGCARAQCALSALKQDPSLTGDVYFYVCRYAARGNIDEAYTENVKPKSDGGVCE